VPFSMHVTATSGGSDLIGIRVAVKVLTGAADLQNGATASQSCDFTASAAHQATLTTTVTGSLVYGAIESQGSTSLTAHAGTTLTQYLDATVNERFADCVTTSATGTPGSVTVGASAPTTTGGGCALAEILPDGTLAEDPSAPAVAVSESATTVSTADFTPPGGSLLVALVSAVGNTGVETMALSGGGVTWAPLSEANVANGGYAGVWIAVAPTPGPGDPIITATQSGSSSHGGMALLVKVLTGAVEAGGTSGAGNSLTGAVAQASITPTANNSLPVFAVSYDGSAAGFGAAASNNTYFDNSGNATDFWSYAHGSYTGTVTSGTPITVGAGVAAGGHSNWAVLELKPTGGSTPAVDASSPPLVTSDTLLTVSTVNFTPPLGSVLVAMVVAGGTASGTGITMTVSGGGLAWTQRVVSNASDNFEPAFIWTATVTGTGAAAPGLQPPEPPRYLPGKRPGAPFAEPFTPWPPWDQSALAAVPPVVPATAAPVQRPSVVPRLPSRARVGPGGRIGAGIAGAQPAAAVTTTAPEPRPAFPRLVPSRARIGPSGRSGAGVASAVVTPLGTPSLPRPFVTRGRVPSRARAGSGGRPGAGIASAVVTPLGAPARPAPLAARGRPASRARCGPGGSCGAGLVPAPVTAAAAAAPRHPVQFRPGSSGRAVTGPRRAGGGIASGTVTPRGTPGPAWRPQPRRPGPSRAAWHGQAGPAAVAPVTPQAYQHPLPQPRRPGPSRAVTGRGRCGAGQAGGANAAPVTQGQPRPLPRPRPPRRATWHGNAGPPPAPPGTPARRPGPVITGRPRSRATWRGNAGPQPPPAVPPPKCKPLAPRRRQQRATLRRGAGLVNLLPPAFTIGSLTAATAGTATLAGGTAASILTAGTASPGTLTTTTAVTGGPS